MGKFLLLSGLIFVLLTSHAPAVESNKIYEPSERQIERNRLLNKIEQNRIESGQIKTREFLTSSNNDPLKKEYYNAVLQRLRVIGNENYPPKIAALGQSSKVMVFIRLDKNGKLIDVNMPVESEHKLVNDYVRNVLKSSEPYPIFDSEIFLETIESVVIITTIELNVLEDAAKDEIPPTNIQDLIWIPKNF
jgi:outer membrane biosynthesis protein TonB